MDRAGFEEWIAAYERAWRTAGTEPLRGLFSEDATYRMSPFATPARGLAAIGELWERERTGPDEEFELSHEVIAVEGETAVARIDVAYGDGKRYRDLWIVRFDDDGRCREFEEWAYWPRRSYVDPGPTPPSP